MPGTILGAGDMTRNKAKCRLLYNLHSILVSEQSQSQKKTATVVIPKAEEPGNRQK